MAEVPQGEHATFSFLDLITLALVLDAIPDFTHGKVWDGVICFWLAYANHAIGVRWRISRYLIPPAALTLFVYAFMWCIDIGRSEMKYISAGVIGAAILMASVAAYSWIWKTEPPAGRAGVAATPVRAEVALRSIDFVRPPDAPMPNVPLVPGKPFILDLALRVRGDISAAHSGAFVLIDIATSDNERDAQEQLWARVRALANASPYGENSIDPERDALFAAQYPMPGDTTTSPVSKEDIDQIMAGTKKILLAFIVKYKDHHGAMETQRCQSYSGTTWRYWSDCFGHNQIVPVAAEGQQ